MFKNFSPLVLASKNGDVKSVKYFLRHGVKHIPDELGRTPLYHASLLGNKEIVEILLENGATQEPDIYGYAPLDVIGDDKKLKSILLHYF